MAGDNPERDEALIPPQTWRVIGDRPEIPDAAVSLGGGIYVWPSDRPEGEYFIPAPPREDD